MFEASFNAAMDRYRKLLGQADSETTPCRMTILTLVTQRDPENIGSTMRRTRELLDALAKQNFATVPPELRAELLEFYGHPDAPYATKRKPKAWMKVQAQLEQLKKAAPPVVTKGPDAPLFSVRSSE